MAACRSQNQLYLTIRDVRGETLSFGTFPSREAVTEWLAGFGFGVRLREDGGWLDGTITTRRPRRKIHDYRKIWAWPPNVPGAGRWDTFTGT